MSNKHKLNWFIVIVYGFIVLCLGYLVAVQLTRDLNNRHDGLECISNCQGFNDTVKSLR